MKIIKGLCNICEKKGLVLYLQMVTGRRLIICQRCCENALAMFDEFHAEGDPDAEIDNDREGA